MKNLAQSTKMTKAMNAFRLSKYAYLIKSSGFWEDMIKLDTSFTIAFKTSTMIHF